HYYGDDYFAAARADTLTTTERLGAELVALQTAGATDILLYPASGRLEPIGLLRPRLLRRRPRRHPDHHRAAGRGAGGAADRRGDRHPALPGLGRTRTDRTTPATTTPPPPAPTP